MTEPLTAERLAAIEADLEAAWSEAGETSPVVARAVNGAYILLSRYQRLAAEVARLRTLITAPDGGRIPIPATPVPAPADEEWRPYAGEPVCQRPCRRPSPTIRGLVELCDPWHGQPDAASADEGAAVCSDKAGWHGPHDYRPEPDSGIASCPGYPPPIAAPVVAEATQAEPDDWPDLDEDYEPPCGDPECREMHCGRCKEHSGSMGHYTSVCHRLGGLNGPTVPHHQCCPGNCANAAPDAVPAAAADGDGGVMVVPVEDRARCGRCGMYGHDEDGVCDSCGTTTDPAIGWHDDHEAQARHGDAWRDR